VWDSFSQAIYEKRDKQAKEEMAEDNPFEKKWQA
jgi:hypothetical protein